MSSKQLLALAIFLIAAISLYFYFKSDSTAQEGSALKTSVVKGSFDINVTATGELKAKKSEKIRGPQGMRAAGIYQTTIADIIPEGTIVKAGQFVASLDRTELANKLSDAQTEIDKIKTQLEQAKIDTAIELRGVRNSLANLKFSLKEKQLQVEQSKYEPEMVIHQAEIEMERTNREYTQTTQNFELKQKQSLAKIQEIQTLLKQNENKLGILSKLSNSFNIMAPKDGMVIYSRSWDGKKQAGSQISSWDPVVAELPDLTDMISKTFVNEVDISRVQKGQEVKIKVDAFPENEYSGKVLKVANIGEQLRNQDAKVFEVIVQVYESDSILRPAMTTSNEILTDIYEDVLYIPIEALQRDSIAFVYKSNNGQTVKQEVISGVTNDDSVVIDHGLAEGDEVLLTIPEAADQFKFVPLDPAIKEKIRKKQEEEIKARKALALERQKSVGNENIPTDNGSSSRIIIFE